MSLANALRGWDDEPREPESPGTRATKEPQPASARVPAAPQTRERGAAEARALRYAGKRDHPDFTAVKVFLTKSTHKAVKMRLLQEEREDLSELVERLVKGYLGTRGGE